MKDAISCDKLRGVASKLRSGDFRMGKPTCSHVQVCMSEYIAYVGKPGELKHLSNLRKRKKNRLPK